MKVETGRILGLALAAGIALACVPGNYGVNFAVRPGALEDGTPAEPFSEEDLELAKAVAAEVAEKFEMASIFDRYGDEFVHNGQRELALYERASHGQSQIVFGVSVKEDMSELLLGFQDKTSSMRNDENMDLRDELKWRLEKAFPDREIEFHSFKKTPF